MKRFLAVAAVVTLMACGGGGGGSPTATSTPTPSATPLKFTIGQGPFTFHDGSDCFLHTCVTPTLRWTLSGTLPVTSRGIKVILRDVRQRECASAAGWTSASNDSVQGGSSINAADEHWNFAYTNAAPVCGASFVVVDASVQFTSAAPLASEAVGGQVFSVSASFTHQPSSSPNPTPNPTANPTPNPTPTPAPTPTPKTCCKICTVGKACGDSCIAKENTCHQPPGCACDGFADVVF